jgi:hypothetical protein
MFTFVPTIPLEGVNAVMLGRRAKFEPVETDPAAVVIVMDPETAFAGTTAVSDVSEFCVNVAFVPLNFTERVPVRPVPIMNTFVPTVPFVGEKLVIPGSTVNVVLLLSVPATLVTVILPLIAAAGTIASISVGEAIENDAEVPLKVTEVT